MATEMNGPMCELVVGNAGDGVTGERRPVHLQAAAVRLDASRQPGRGSPSAVAALT
jgi:hypothetical protein